MTTEQRLSTVEGDLEAVKQLLVSAANYAESANRGLDQLTNRVDQLTASQNRTQAQLDQLVASQSQAFTRLDRIERALDALVSNQIAEREARLALREDLEILYQTVQQSSTNIEQLTERVDQLTQNLNTSVQDLVGTIGRLADDAALDREEMQRIWNYLLHQSGNGSQGG